MSDIIDDFEAKTEPIPLLSCRIRVDGALQKRLSRKGFFVSLAALILGAAALIAYLSLSVAANYYPSVGGGWTAALLWGGAVFFVFGIVFLAAHAKSVGNMERAACENVYTFYGEYFTVETFRGGESVGTVKQAYADCALIREKGRFVLFYLPNGTFFPVDKSVLTGEELARLRALLSDPKKNPKKKS